MKYKKGDKIVVKVDKVGCNITGNQLLIFDPANDVGLSADNELVLGKVDDFQLDNKKIKMTAEEKAEFDKLYPDTWQDVTNFLNDIYDFPDDYPNLKKRLYSKDRTNNFHSQIEFVRALEKPSLIEVEKEKKYYIHLFKSQSNGYLNQCRDSSGFLISYIDETCRCKTQFTQSEIDELQKQEQFKAIDLNKCKEEVEGEND